MSALFYIDKGGEDDNEKKSLVSLPKDTQSMSVWEDEDDVQQIISLHDSASKRRLKFSKKEILISSAEYKNRLEKKRQLCQERPKWAEISEKNTLCRTLSVDPFSILRLKDLSNKSGLLPDIISIKRNQNVFHGTADSPVVDVHFHLEGTLVVCAFKTGDIKVFDISATEKSKPVYSLNLKGVKILSSRFFGERILITTEKKILVWLYGKSQLQSLMIGKNGFKSICTSSCDKFIAVISIDGTITVISYMNLRVIKKLAIRGEVLCCTFTHDDSLLIAYGSDAGIYIWNTTDFSNCDYTQDESGVPASCMVVSRDGSFLYLGLTNGILKVYRVDSLLASAKNEGKCAPFKELFNLTTSVDGIVVHPESELLIYYSTSKRCSIRLVHQQTLRVYSNWPRSSSSLSTITSVALSPSGKQFVIGNKAGSILTFELKHYTT